MIRTAWIKCISSQAVTARRHVWFVKITQFIQNFPWNLIRFERQSCRNLLICLCLKTVQAAWWCQHRENCIMDYHATQSSVCVLLAQAVVLLLMWLPSSTFFFHLSAAFLFRSYYILPPFHIFSFSCSY